MNKPNAILGAVHEVLLEHTNEDAFQRSLLDDPQHNEQAMGTSHGLVDREVPIDTTMVAISNLPLDQLAVAIKRAHEAAEYSMRDSLSHARSAGVNLLEVKSRLRHGEWMPWVRTHCGISHSTTNLYMKIAKRWDTLGDSQQVVNLTLRQASQLLYLEPSDEDAEFTAELINLKLLDWGDLEGLEPLEVRALVKEVRSYYEDLCFEPDEALAAKRATLHLEWNPIVTLDRNAVRSDAQRVATELRVGKIGRAKVRTRLRHIEITVLDAKAKELRVTGGKNVDTKSPRERIVLRHVEPLEGYDERARRFIEETRTLLTRPHGLLNKRLTLSTSQRQRLGSLIADVRNAVDQLEGQVGLPIG
jgi:hypothetical protein